MSIDGLQRQPIRTFERVPAGANFKLEMILNVFSMDKEERLVETLKEALRLLQDDYLGGHGSRGYGQIEITNLSFEERDKSFMKRISMARFKIVRLEFRSPLHLGRGLGEAYDTAEKTLHSDTLSGALTSAFCMLCLIKIH